MSLIPEHATRSHLADRYGSTRGRWPSGKLAAAGGVALAVAFGVLLAFVAYRTFGADPITAQRVAFEEGPDNTMELTFDVHRDDPHLPAVCIVRVMDANRAETGRKEVLVPAGQSDVRLSTIVRSSELPVTADVVGCSYSVPAYLSSGLRPTG